MKSKKKSQSKPRSARNRAAKSGQAAVETTSIEPETHSSKEELASKEIEIPIPNTELSSESNLTNIVEEKIPIQEQEPPSIEKKTSNGEESSDKEKLAFSKGDNTINKVQETSDNAAQMPSQVLSNVISEQMESSEVVEAVKTSAIPSASQSAIKDAPKVIEDIKHPLEHNWGFWLNTNENKKNWTENQKELTVFNTVEDYWCLYHYMKHPSELLVGQDYGVFKQGIKPMWEDSANHNGGKWFINIERKGQEVDRIWLDVVLLMIGQNFENSNIICGAVVNIKLNNKHRVSIWTRTKEEVPNMEIGKKLKGILGLNQRLQFIDHKTNHALFTI